MRIVALGWQGCDWAVLHCAELRRLITQGRLCQGILRRTELSEKNLEKCLPEWYLTPAASYMVISVKHSATANSELASPNSSPTAVVTACNPAHFPHDSCCCFCPSTLPCILMHC